MWRATLLTACLLTFPTSASAQDFDFDDDIDFEDAVESAEEPPPPPIPEGDDDFDFLDEDEEDEALLEFTDPVDEDGEGPVDLLGDEEEAVAPARASGDSAALYRMRQAEYSRLSTDEEIAAWESYLEEFPHTPFSERIQQRVDELMDRLYDVRIRRDDGAVDAMHQEIGFSQGALLESIDPRTRLRAGFEIGLPDWMNGFVDYEYALNRQFSMHAGIRRRYTGWSFEPGARWALVKSARTNTIVTLLGDLRVNMSPSAFIGARPMLAVGKRFGDKLDLQFQAGPDFEFRNGVDIRAVAAANITYRATETVGLFLEGSGNVKNIGGQAGAGYFNVVTFGMRFFPSREKAPKGRSNAQMPVDNNVQVDMGATVPFSTNYYSFHFGSVFGQATLYLDD